MRISFADMGQNRIRGNDMDDLISRQTDCVLTEFGDCSYSETGCADCEVKARIRNALSVQPERKRGEWVVWGGMDIPENHGRHICSLCGEFAPVRYEKPLIKEYLSDFCPNCGADMREGGE